MGAHYDTPISAALRGTKQLLVAHRLVDTNADIFEHFGIRNHNSQR